MDNYPIVFSFYSPWHQRYSTGGISPNCFENCRYPYLCSGVIMVICNFYMGAFLLSAHDHVWWTKTLQPYCLTEVSS